jgi:hypothetical protein
MKHTLAALLLLASCGHDPIQMRNVTLGAAYPMPMPSQQEPKQQPAPIHSLREIDETRAKIQPFLDAVAQVESLGCDNVVGDKGKAIGRFQIWQIYWQDALAYCPKIGGQYKDCTQKLYAERVVVAYLLKFARKAVDAKDWQTLARIHNGGPRGATKEATKPYWVKVRKELAKRK